MNLEVVHEPACARQSEPEPLSGRETITHGVGDHGDARPAIASNDDDTHPTIAVGRSTTELAIVRMYEHVACDFRGGGHQPLNGARGKAIACAKRSNPEPRFREVRVITKSQSKY